jgi:FtsH-binding integral membrane protein
VSLGTSSQRLSSCLVGQPALVHIQMQLHAVVEAKPGCSCCEHDRQFSDVSCRMYSTAALGLLSFLVFCWGQSFCSVYRGRLVGFIQPAEGSRAAACLIQAMAMTRGITCMHTLTAAMKA